MLNEVLLAVMLTHSPPGVSRYSLMPAPDCTADAPQCDGAIRSSFFGGWVVTESREAGRARYRIIVDKLIAAGKRVVCKDENEELIPDCTPISGAEPFALATITTLALTAGIAESGFREDVMNGRGRSGRTKPTDHQYDDAGGEGRGPANEACFMQIHPGVYPNSEELLGYAGIENCFYVGMSLMLQAHRYCLREKKRAWHDWDFRLFSMYGTGSYCASTNLIKLKVLDKYGKPIVHSRTQYRTDLFRKLRADVRARLRKARADQTTRDVQAPSSN